MNAVSRPVEPGDAGYVFSHEDTTAVEIYDNQYNGYVVEHQGVRVRFNRHKDVMAVLSQYPEAKVVV